MKQRYSDQQLQPARMAVIEQANAILTEYTRAGLVMTLRQLYYQFVSRGLMPNTPKDYKRLGEIVSIGRLAGHLDWDAIEDRGRVAQSPSQWPSVKSIMDVAIRQFRLPRWENQMDYVELWVEKQALAGVLEPLCREFHVTLMVNKGYSSSSAMRESALRFMESGRGKRLHLGYLGDHDPSGEDMVRDITDRLAVFGVKRLDVHKIGLTMAQIRQYNPPPNPAKVTDSRFAAYQMKYGDESWEVDALDPRTLQGLMREYLSQWRDPARLKEVLAEEERQKTSVRSFIENLQVRAVERAQAVVADDPQERPGRDTGNATYCVPCMAEQGDSMGWPDSDPVRPGTVYECGLCDTKFLAVEDPDDDR